MVVSASPAELDEEGWALRRELVDRESHISLLALTILPFVDCTRQLLKARLNVTHH